MTEVLFSKFSRDREKQFQIATSIECGEQGKYVVKRPVSPEAETHIKRMEQSCGILSEQYDKKKAEVCPCRLEGNAIYFPYIEGENLGRRISRHAKENQFEKVCEDYRLLWDLLSSQMGLKRFERTPEFQDMFGEVHISEDSHAVKVSNIDLLADNLLITSQKPVIVDYEWVFHFPIPIEFIYARSVFLQEAVAGFGEERQKELYAIAGITLQEKQEYYQMEVAFQEYAAGKKEKNVLGKLYPKMGRRNYYLGFWNKEEFSYRVSADFIYEDRKFRAMEYKEYLSEFHEKFYVPDTSECKSLVVRPAEKPCVLQLWVVAAEIAGKGQHVNFTHNAAGQEGNFYFFDKPPRIEVENNRFEMIRLDWRYVRNSEELASVGAGIANKENLLSQRLAEVEEQLKQSQREAAEQQKVIEHLEQKVWQLEHLKVVRAYMKAKAIMKKE